MKNFPKSLMKTETVVVLHIPTRHSTSYLRKLNLGSVVDIYVDDYTMHSDLQLLLCLGIGIGIGKE